LGPSDIQREERRFRKISSFLVDLVRELNHLSEEGCAVLVEGKRDTAALRGLGYSGPLYTVSILTSSPSSRERLRREVKKMIILTDLDAEGRRLASRYVRFLSAEGVAHSLSQRRRLSMASRGVFLHIENLRRFALAEGLPEPQDSVKSVAQKLPPS
jgi:5S rRNA maturation endonuclease (ribonuclease M5)